MSSFNFKPVSQSEKTKPIFEKPKNCNKLAQKVYKIGALQNCDRKSQA